MIGYLMVVLAALIVLALGFWLTRPVSVGWRWLARILLAAVLLALLTPAAAIAAVQDWVRHWLPLAATAGSATGADWVVHFLSFAALGALLFHARRDLPPAWLGAGLIVLGGLTELLQLFVDGRSAAVSDLVADALGVAVGYGIARAMGWRLAPR